ncbi:hypothetical protein PENANT_c056G07011 [Penicillium antarcticum]|uniref:Uncharacterized protein n=1 Tax=Penicillium antarcticum TaxID=416450 RepID=A0A1V6PQJ5_9EURO|nr:hypothetical protein PENANT_c056G07011 [Penicillium antarcticum]
MDTWYAVSDTDKMVKSIEQGHRMRAACGRWFWNTVNFLPPGMILTSFLLFPPVLQGPSSHDLSKKNASIGAAFALAACGFLPLSLLPFTGLRSRMSLLGNKLCLTAGLLGALNVAIHLAYDLTTSKMVVAALALAVSQIVCYTAVIWLRSRGSFGKQVEFSMYSHRDRPGRHLSNLQMRDEAPKNTPSNLDGQQIWI